MLEGRLTIDLTRKGRAIERAAIASTRPLHIARVFEGKSPQALVDGLPLLFTLCAAAQGCAAARASEQALGLEPCGASEAARDALVLAETAREHLLRIALDWPALVGEAVAKSGMASITRAVPALRAALFGERRPFGLGARVQTDAVAVEGALTALDRLIGEVALGEPADAFLERRTPADFEAWAETGRTCAARLVHRVHAEGWAEAGHSEPSFLPDLDPQALARRLTDDHADAFTARPEWEGSPRETTALARRRASPLVADLLTSHGTSLATRLAARLIELAELPQELRALAARAMETPAAPEPADWTRKDGEGLAQVEAARGRLVHAIRIVNGAVDRYRILAPTEWNFHDDGAAAQGLLRLAPADRTGLETQARLLIDAIDPCVGYELRVR